MVDNVHPVVELLAARMESHPEEFQFHDTSGLAITGRWETWINQLGWHFNETEKELIYGKAKELIFQRIHEEVLDELMNGEERRAQERREHDLEMQRLMAQAQQNTLRPGQYAQVQSLGALQGMGASSIGQSHLQIQSGNMKLGNETLDEGMLKQIKRKLGL